MLPDIRYDKPLIVLIAKVSQRVYKYGGQLYVRDFLTKHYGNQFDSVFGRGTGKAMLHATAGRYQSPSRDKTDFQFNWNWRDLLVTPGCTQN
jgi:hypothetical protein